MLITLLISPEAVEMRTTLSRKLFKTPHVCLCNLRFFFLSYIQAKQVNILMQLTAGSLAQMVPKKQNSEQQGSIFNDEPGPQQGKAARQQATLSTVGAS